MTTAEIASLQETENAEVVHARGLWGDVWHQYRKHKLAMGSTLLLGFIILLITVGPAIWKTDPQKIDIPASFSDMTLQHPFGADNLGRDMLARVI
ncbi:MAG: hypothetical protein K8I60_12790, partial [Anaerolineae bacterium]|nr:hypothetical protein [Anaerolineae bacterium]